MHTSSVLTPCFSEEGICIKADTRLFLFTPIHVARAWYIGSEKFREHLLDRLEKRPQGVDLSGGQRREHNERMAEKLIQAGLNELDVTEKRLLDMKANSMEKQAVAWLIKTQTTVTGEWIAKRLNFGHSSNRSRSLRRFRTTENQEIQNLKDKMTKYKAWCLFCAFF